MSYQNYLERMRLRNQNLKAYHLRNPDIKQVKLGRIFKISQSRISRILSKEERNAG